MDSPIGAVGFAVFTRAVKRVDDPDATGGQPDRVVAAFFRQDCVIGACVGKSGDKELVGAAVSVGAQRARLHLTRALAKLHQQMARALCQRRGERVVVSGVSSGRHTPILPKSEFGGTKRV